MYIVKDQNREYKVYNFGERGSGIKPRGPIQDYRAIKKDLFSKGKLWTDDIFPPVFSSLAKDKGPTRNRQRDPLQKSN